MSTSYNLGNRTDEQHFQVLVSLNCVFDASLAPGTCLHIFVDLKGFTNKFLKSRVTGHL